MKRFAASTPGSLGDPWVGVAVDSTWMEKIPKLAFFLKIDTPGTPFTPLKYHLEPKTEGLVQMFFLF